METAAATPAPWPVTVQAIMFLMAAWLVLSPATARPATSFGFVYILKFCVKLKKILTRLFTAGGTRIP